MPPQAISKSALVTGCSTGIGRATTLRLAERGWKRLQLRSLGS